MSKSVEDLKRENKSVQRSLEEYRIEAAANKGVDEATRKLKLKTYLEDECKIIIENYEKKIAAYEEEIRKLKVSVELYVSKTTNQDVIKYDQQGILEKDRFYESIASQSPESMDRLSTIMADHLTLQYKITERYLRTKKNPTIKKADEIAELKKKTKMYISEYKLMLYTYESLLSSIPVIEDYSPMDVIEFVSQFDQQSNESDDEISEFLSIDEYNKLTLTERNQLALERYHSAKFKKSKWIGRDYKLFVGFQYEMKNFLVIYTGIKHKFEDLGRDLVCHNNDEVLDYSM